MTAGLKQGLDGLRAGSLTLDEFLQKIELAIRNVPIVFAHILESLEEPDEDLSGYLDGVRTSLSDCQAMFLSGLDEMSRFAEDEDPFHLRFGWLLVEKGEQEYVEIIDALARDAGDNGEFHGARDLFGLLAERLDQGLIDREEYLDTLDRFEESAHSCLDKAQKMIESGLDAARRYNGEDSSVLRTATEHSTRAADELGAWSSISIILNSLPPEI